MTHRRATGKCVPSRCQGRLGVSKRLPVEIREEVGWVLRQGGSITRHLTWLQGQLLQEHRVEGQAMEEAVLTESVEAVQAALGVGTQQLCKEEVEAPTDGGRRSEVGSLHAGQHRSMVILRLHRKLASNQNVEQDSKGPPVS